MFRSKVNVEDNRLYLRIYLHWAILVHCSGTNSTNGKSRGNKLLKNEYVYRLIYGRYLSL